MSRPRPRGRGAGAPAAAAVAAATPLSSSSPSSAAAASSTLPVCQFFRQGNCLQGEECKFLHDLSAAKLCEFHIQASCRFGPRCHFIHGDPCEHCKRNVIHPFNPKQSQEHIVSCKKLGPTDCSICYERVEKFGLLSGCDHCFCLNCILTWRKSKANLDDSGDVNRRCPMCREPSDFVIPSAEFATGDRKLTIIAEHKIRLSKRPCKHFARRQDCPFGNTCFYAHNDERGNRVVLPERRYRRRPRGHMWSHFDIDDSDDDEDDFGDDLAFSDYDDEIDDEAGDLWRLLTRHVMDPSWAEEFSLSGLIRSILDRVESPGPVERRRQVYDEPVQYDEEDEEEEEQEEEEEEEEEQEEEANRQEDNEARLRRSQEEEQDRAFVLEALAAAEADYDVHRPSTYLDELASDGLGAGSRSAQASSSSASSSSRNPHRWHAHFAEEEEEEAEEDEGGGLSQFSDDEEEEEDEEEEAEAARDAAVLAQLERLRSNHEEIDDNAPVYVSIDDNRDRLIYVDDDLDPYRWRTSLEDNPVPAAVVHPYSRPSPPRPAAAAAAFSSPSDASRSRRSRRGGGGRGRGRGGSSGPRRPQNRQQHGGHVPPAEHRPPPARSPPPPRPPTPPRVREFDVHIQNRVDTPPPLEFFSGSRVGIRSSHHHNLRRELLDTDGSAAGAGSHGRRNNRRRHPNRRGHAHHPPPAAPAPAPAPPPLQPFFPPSEPAIEPFNEYWPNEEVESALDAFVASTRARRPRRGRRRHRRHGN